MSLKQITKIVKLKPTFATTTSVSKTAEAKHKIEPIELWLAEMKKADVRFLLKENANKPLQNSQVRNEQRKLANVAIKQLTQQILSEPHRECEKCAKQKKMYESLRDAFQIVGTLIMLFLAFQTLQTLS